jgi:hypothetical protein
MARWADVGAPTAMIGWPRPDPTATVTKTLAWLAGLPQALTALAGE